MPPMDPQTLQAITWSEWGNRCDYKYGVTQTLPQGTTLDLFTVTGLVLVKLLIGKVTTLITGANNTKLIAHPATGTDVDLCSVLDITGLEVGAKLTLIGTFATALQKGLAGAVQGMNILPIIVGNSTYVTTIRLSCAGSDTGSMIWRMFWMPLTDGASAYSA